jgi:23S rRNA pseudouridine1911/1915/1917 synthase
MAADCSTFTPPEGCVGERIDRALTHHPQIRSRSRAEKLIALGLVQLNGKIIKPSHKCRSGDVFEIQFPPETSSDLTPWDFALDICYEDAHLLVVNKPAGLVVHPSYGHDQHTLVHALLHHTQDLSVGFHEKRPGIVHRLDKETSGLLVVAKTDAAQEHLAQQFRARTVRRLYWALAHGRFEPASGTRTTLLNRHPKDRKRFASATSGKRATTHYKVLWLSKNITKLECRLETGRTHQIRVHLSELGHPIIGDQLYGSNSRLKTMSSSILKQNIASMQRIGLHARELGFVHPASGKSLHFTADWPSDLQPILHILESSS